MKTIVAYFCLAAVLVLAGALCLDAGLLDRNMANAQQDVLASNYDQADRTFAASQPYFEYASHLSWIGDGPVNDIRARRAAIRYWQGNYASVISQQADGGNGAGADNIGLQLVAANAVFRAGQIQAKDRKTLLQAVEAGIQANLAILKDTARQDEAAYNYEYLTRLRNKILNNEPDFKISKPLNDPNGLSGSIMMEGGDSTKFKTIIPLTIEERKDVGGAGKIPPPKHKG
jgi:hypothetical protein